MTDTHGFDLEDLAVLRTVVRTGSLTAAASVLHYTQSGVSRRIAQLERSVGVPLLVRLARGTRPTPAGELVLGHAEGMLGRADALVEDLRALRDGTGGRLRVGSFATANSSLTPAALRALPPDMAAVATTVVEDLSPALVEGVDTGALDLAVVSDYPTGTLDARGTTLVPLLDDPLFVALPANHPRTRSRHVRLGDLRDERWVAGHDDRTDTVLTAAAERAGFVPRLDMRVASWTAKLSFVGAGLGVTLVPGLLASAVPRGVTLQPLHDDIAPRRVFAALPSATEPVAAAGRFLDCLRRAADIAANQATDQAELAARAGGGGR